jgi:hypothetical protein
MHWLHTTGIAAGELAVGATSSHWNPFARWASEGFCKEMICSADKDKIKKLLGE